MVHNRFIQFKSSSYKTESPSPASVPCNISNSVRSFSFSFWGKGVDDCFGPIVTVVAMGLCYTNRKRKCTNEVNV